MLEWQLVTQWSHASHSRFPAATQAAFKTLLLASAQNHGGAYRTPTPEATPEGGRGLSSATHTVSASSSSSSDGKQLLGQLPGPVLEQVFAAAALPQGTWAAAAAPRYTQLVEALTARPHPPQDELGFGLGWPEAFLAGAGLAGGQPPQFGGPNAAGPVGQ
jgi:hypothetical protein